MPKIPETARAERKASILDAMMELLLEVGLAELRISEVAKRAGVGKGTVYRYFPSKDAMLAEFAMHRLDTLMPRLEEIRNESRTGLDEVLGIMNAKMNFLLESPPLFRVMHEWWQAPEVDDESDAFRRYRERVTSMMGRLVSAMERGKRDGSIRQDLRTTTYSMYAMSSTMGIMVTITNAESVSRRITLPFEFRSLQREHLESLARSLRDGANAEQRDGQETAGRQWL